jgi:nucleoside recognition membrane protein YjiH
MDVVKNSTSYEKRKNEDFENILKMVVYSFMGVIIFFIPININNEFKTILYHISDTIQRNYNNFLEISIVIYSFLIILKNYNQKSKITIFLKSLSLLILISLFYSETSLFIKDENTILIIKTIIFNLITVLPISSIFMPFILEYGLLEIVESYFHPIMKKLFRISGKSFLNLLIFYYLIQIH